MRVAWATDVHLNFLDAKGSEEFARRVSGLSPQAVFLTGDISDAPALEEHLLSLDARLGVPIYFVLEASWRCPAGMGNARQGSDFSKKRLSGSSR